MRKARALSSALMAIALFISSENVSAQEATPRRIAPPGFRMIADEPGIVLWRKSKEYMQVISPHRGAEVHLLHGAITVSYTHLTLPTNREV